MPSIRIDSPQDPRIAPYVDLRDRQLRARQGRFVAEGELIVRRLLESRFEVESLLVAERQLGRIEVPPSVPVYCASSQMLEAITGFRFHRGILAIGVRPTPTNTAPWPPPCRDKATIVVCSAISDAENLGGILRNCAAFGVDGVLICNRSVDPFTRRVLRVSMATALKLEIRVTSQLNSDLESLHRDHGFQCVATVLDPSAQRLNTVPRPRRLALVLGNELHGVESTTLACCQERVTIPMSLETNSLNVAVAAGIFLYHFSQLAASLGSA